MKRILIVAVSAGAGHLQAAAAVARALAETRPELEVRNVDVLEHASAGYRRTYSQSYLGLVRHLPGLWGFLYERTDRQEAKAAARRLMRFMDRLNTRSFMRLLRDFAPDRILCTHFMPAGLLGRARQTGQLAAPFQVVLTDHDLHAFWLAPEVDRYYAPDDEIAHLLRKAGVARERISVTGIPVNPAFGRLPDPEQIRREFGLPTGPGSGPTVLLASGGFGVGDLTEAIRAAFAAANGRPISVLAVCGRNKRLEEKARALVAPTAAKLVVFGFTDRMPELMAASALMVTKPGGLTTSEGLAAGLPMIVVAAIPGQEEGNRNYLLEHGAAVAARNLGGLEYQLARLLFDEPEALARMRESAQKLGRPRAAFAIAEELTREEQKK